MNSMTGFGRASATKGSCTAQVELSTVNRKTLDLQTSLPPKLAALDAEVGKVLRTCLHRGRVNLRVKVEESAEALPVHFQEERAEQLLKEVNAFAAEQNLNPLEDVKEVLKLPGVWAESTLEDAGPHAAEAVREAVQAALDSLMKMRQLEGAELKMRLEDIRVALIETVSKVAPLVKEAREEQEARLRERVEEVGELQPEMQTRLYQEVVLYAEKSDVQEEVDRLGAHLEQMAIKMEEEGPVGRALDFLCQEMAREFNTLSVKASRTDINQTALQGKELVEQLREQVQNIE